MLRAMYLLPLLLWVVSAQKNKYGDEEFNVTTVGPDDETIDTLVAAIESAAATIEEAIAGTIQTFLIL